MTKSDPYRLVAGVYDRVLEPVIAPLRSVARGLTDPQAEWTVLDVGCGTGAALAEYAGLGCQVIGVDSSEAMISVARDRLGPDIELHANVTDKLPVLDDSVDLVHLGLVLHSLSHDESAQLLGQIGRVLKPGGMLVVIDFSAGTVQGPRGWYNRALSVVAEMLAGPTHARNSLAFQRAGGLDSLADEAGWRFQQSKVVGAGNMVVAVLTQSPNAVD